MTDKATVKTVDDVMAKYRKRVPLFACQECGHKFYSAKAAERAMHGDDGCPRCGGTDIDLYA